MSDIDDQIEAFSNNIALYLISCDLSNKSKIISDIFTLVNHQVNTKLRNFNTNGNRPAISQESKENDVD